MWQKQNQSRSCKKERKKDWSSSHPHSWHWCNPSVWHPSPPELVTSPGCGHLGGGIDMFVWIIKSLKTCNKNIIGFRGSKHHNQILRTTHRPRCWCICFCACCQDDWSALQWFSGLLCSAGPPGEGRKIGRWMLANNKRRCNGLTLS